LRAWTVDADDIRIAEDFDEALLHRTPEIDGFLSVDRDDKFIVVGTKGFGKTLLLKAKRILYQRNARATCLPAGNLLDKPIGDKVFSKDGIAFFEASPLPWAKVWLTAIGVTILKQLGQADDLKVNAKLAGVIADQRLHSVIDHFVRLIDFSPGDLQRSATDTDGHLVPRLRSVTQPVAIFIDGIDEYFGKHIESRGSPLSVTGPLSANVWHFAQLGLVQVAYQLRRINHHLKVFAAVRKEAFSQLTSTVMSQQYRGSAVDIGYSVASLREIFVNNVRLLKADRMADPDLLRDDPIAAFLGRAEVSHPCASEREDVFDYICRHTLLRPRDLMTVGERLSALRPEERRHEHRLKETVHEAATEIAQEYLNEIAPHTVDLDIERLLRRLPGPVLTREELEDVYLKHNIETDAVEERHVFCALYRVGLLGHVQRDWVQGTRVQRFLRPGEGTLEPDGVLPKASHYLVHPVLSDRIGRVNPGYLQRLGGVNVVGHARPWRDEAGADSSVTSEQLCVMVGDVQSFGAMMRDGADGPVRDALVAAVRRWSAEAVVAEFRAGDSIAIVHRDPVVLAQIARHILDEVFRAPGHPRLRVALHHGEVQTRRTEDGTLVLAGGEAVLCVVRVEPHVEAGQMWATDEFRDELAKVPSLWRTTPIAGFNGDGLVNVKKSHTGEPDIWVRLHRLEF